MNAIYLPCDTNIDSPATIEFAQLYADASGAPAKIRYGRYVFACDTLGETTINLIAPTSGSRVESKIAADVCRRAYAKFLARNVDAAWLEANRALYA